MIKRLIIYVIIFMSICFLLPIMVVKTREIAQEEITMTNDNDKEEVKENEKKDYTKIKLFHTGTNEIEEIGLDEYLYGVVSAEMPANFEKEALKAQAVVARTYTIYQIKNAKKHENADICDDSACCQAYITKDKRLAKWNEEEREANWKKIVEAVDSTSGEIITYNGMPINSFFHANSGGNTELVSNVWGGTDFPYLQAVATSGEENYKQYSSSVILTKQEVLEKLKNIYPDIIIDFNAENAIQILEYTEGGRIRTIKFGNKEISGVEVRKIFSLKSAKFNVIISGENVIFDVVGYGHGVGMSQTGANSMAKENKTYEEIIKHFYSNVEIKKMT